MGSNLSGKELGTVPVQTYSILPHHSGHAGEAEESDHAGGHRQQMELPRYIHFEKDLKLFQISVALVCRLSGRLAAWTSSYFF